jgi:hypothetical protein
MSTVPRWPLAVIAAPAAVSIWSGWVGLGGMCGFGMVQPLPGILPLHINTALTLPLGIESYAALALGAWLRPGTKGKARRFARWSALGSLGLGMLGQVSYHLLAARHATQAPDIVVVLVSCLPVVVLGCAVALLHLLSASQPATTSASRAPKPKPAPERTRSASAARTRSAPASAQDAESEFMSELASGALPSQRQIRARLHVGQDRARQLHEHLTSVAAAESVST